MDEKRKVKYLSYYTFFSAKGDINVQLSNYACFANAINRGRVHNEKYVIYLFKELTPALHKNCSNYCPLTKDELIFHIKQARRLFKFEYLVEEELVESSVGKYQAYKVTLVVDAPHFYHRYLLTWVRYAYEFPFNIILLEAIRLKKFAIMRETLPNLFILVTHTIPHPNYNSGHSIGTEYYRNQFLKEATLKAKISELAAKGNYSRVNSIYPEEYKPNSKLQAITKSYENDIDYWLEPQNFDERVEKYVRNYKNFIHKKI